MNPAILGALIGAIPGTLAAGLATWASIQASRTNLQQTKLQLADDHFRWIREKRADVYIQALEFLAGCDQKRFYELRARTDIDALRATIKASLDIYKSPDIVRLNTTVSAYASPEARRKFDEAWAANNAAWGAANKGLTSATFAVSSELKKAMDHATKTTRSFIDVARRDLYESGGELGLPPSS